jgi:CubicO group peptidase (beta-lactamase class C family)
MLGGGKIDGRDVLPPNWAEKAITNQLPKNSEASYGYFWWPNPDGYAAAGIFGQGIAVYPAEKLVIAINSAYPKATDRTQSEKQRALIDAVRKAANGG